MNQLTSKENSMKKLSLEQIESIITQEIQWLVKNEEPKGLDKSSYTKGLQQAALVLKTAGESIQQEECEWEVDEWRAYWGTSCDNPQAFPEGRLIIENYNFCPYCAKKIKLKKNPN